MNVRKWLKFGNWLQKWTLQTRRAIEMLQMVYVLLTMSSLHANIQPKLVSFFECNLWAYIFLRPLRHAKFEQKQTKFEQGAESWFKSIDPASREYKNENAPNLKIKENYGVTNIHKNHFKRRYEVKDEQAATQWWRNIQRPSEQKHIRIWSNRSSKSQEIEMFVCLPKDAKKAV